jgi:hypothetical protein
MAAWASLVVTTPVYADGTYSERYSTRLEPRDYQWGAHEDRGDGIFDSGHTINLSVDLGIGSDCGRINFEGTLKSTLQNVLNARYFGDLGKDIIAGSPMLLACYFSPTWCSILKHSQLTANLLSQSRLNQCSLIDKYTDSRVEDFYRERQDCIHREISNKGGDLEQAMQSCNNMWTANLKNWAGATLAPSPTNQLIESSAVWAGLLGPTARKSLDLAKSFVGDTVVSRGVVTVQYGPSGAPRSPRTYLLNLQTDKYRALCQDLLPRIGPGQSVDRVVSPTDLSAFQDEWGNPLIDRQTLESLASLPPYRRQIACRKISNAVAATEFSRDLNRAVDTLNVLSQNPNLPPNRQDELRQKARSLEGATSLTMQLERNQNQPLNDVMGQVNAEGQQVQHDYAQELLHNDAATVQTNQARTFFFDCADGVMCD